MGTRKTLKVNPADEWRRKIPDALLDEAQVKRVTNAEARRGHGLRAPLNWNLAGYLFPYLHRGTGEEVYCRVRRDEFDESKSEKKYHGSSSASSERVLYSAPGAAERLARKETTIVLVESEKGVLAIE
ncbi:MAG TPA: hypothetical protein VGJ21_16905, partial [Terracidiphilus sp.]